MSNTCLPFKLPADNIFMCFCYIKLHDLWLTEVRSTPVPTLVAVQVAWTTPGSTPHVNHSTCDNGLYKATLEPPPMFFIDILSWVPNTSLGNLLVILYILFKKNCQSTSGNLSLVTVSLAGKQMSINPSKTRDEKRKVLLSGSCSLMKRTHL